MRVRAKMSGRHTAGPTAPLGGTMSDGQTRVPPEIKPPPLGATTTPPPGGLTAPAITRLAPPPGWAGGGETQTTGAGADPLARYC